VAFDDAGTLHAVWMAGAGDSRTIHYRYVPAGADLRRAQNWHAGESACTNCVDPDLTLDSGGNVYVIYRQRGGGEELRIRRIPNGGSNWDGGARVVADAGQGDMAVTPDGKIHLAFNLGSTVFYARYTSFDSFQREARERISTAGGGNIQPAIAADDHNRAHMLWIQERDNDRRTVYYRQYDGRSLSGPEEVSVPGSKGGDVQRYVDITTSGDGSRVHATWTGFSQNSVGTVYHNKRQDGGWADPGNLGQRQVSSPANGARQPKFAVSRRGSAYLIFAERIGGVMSTRFQRADDLGNDPPAPEPPPTTPPPSTPPVTPPSPPTLGPDCLFFAETGRALCGGFRHYWEEHGGVTRFGFPISSEMTEASTSTGQPQTVQYFERTRFEYQPGQEPPNDVRLGLLGNAVTQGRANDSPFWGVADPGDGSWFPETGHTLRAGFRAYWEANGGVLSHGFPISEEFEEVNPIDNKTYTVQYFERSRFEYHPEHQGTPYEVELGQLGRQVYGSR
jgi:hypothetical protein